jgi:MFS family permease
VTFLHAVVEFAVWITVLVAAFDRGGASAVGTAAAVQLVPAALLAPVVTAAGDRFRRDRVLVASFSLLATAAAAMAASLATDLPFAATLFAATVFNVTLSAVPGSIVSLLVHHARSPMQLVHWNMGCAVGRESGSLVGPLLAAGLLAVGAPWVVTASVAAGCACTAIAVRIRIPGDDREPSTLRLSTTLGDALEGVRHAVSAPGPRRVIVVTALAGVVIGAIDVLLVAVAFDQLGRGGSASAVLAATLAAGGLLGAVVVSRRSVDSLTTMTARGALLVALPIIVLGEPRELAPIVALVGVMGAGLALVEIGTRTLLQRSCNEVLTSRMFGVQESTVLLASALGATIAGVAIAQHDLTVVSVVLGVVTAVTLTGAVASLRSLERVRVAVDRQVLDALSAVPFLEPLPVPTVERLAEGLEHRTVPAGTTIVRQGDEGHHFFVVLEGCVDYLVDGAPAGNECAPTSFGEVALVRDVPRTASAIARTTCRLAVIERPAFLAAIERSARSRQGALEVAGGRRPPRRLPDRGD